MNEKISVIIPTRNRFLDVIRCLESISSQSILPDEIVIVDSSDTEELKDKLNKFSNLDIKYVHTSKPGLTLQRNIGIQSSSGDIVVFSDDDMVLDNDYLKEIIRVFSNRPTENIGAVTGNVIWKTGVKRRGVINKLIISGSHILSAIFLLPRYGNSKFQLSGMPTIIKNDVDKVTKCEFLYGGSMSFRRKVINEFMFDENLQGHSWGEDDDIAYRISRKYQNYFTPFAKIFHNNYSPSTIGNKYTAVKMKMENHYYLFHKNFPQDFKHKCAFWWSFAGLFIREVIMTLVLRNSGGVRGLAGGFSDILRNRSANKQKVEKGGGNV